MTTEDDAGTGYTIDELAAASQVPSRTIRFYQSKGALPPPQIRGRVAYYGPRHLERLELIASLQDRGLRIDAIRDLTGRIDKGELDVNEWLGLEAQLQAPWDSDRPRTCSEAELYELAGARRPGLVAELVRLELVERQKDTFLVRSPALLQLAMRLEASGIDLATASRANEILRKHMARAAEDLAEYFFKHAGEGFGRSGSVEDVTAAFEALRPGGLEAVRLVFGQEMERVLRKLLASGKTASLPGKSKRPRR
ncbi:MAG: MerR family transcriptional regulator [Polyangiaceae bacterium]